MGSPVSPRGCKKRGWLYVPSYVPLLVGRVASYSMALAFGVSASIQSAAWAPGNVTDHGRALTDNGRALLQHEFQRTGSFCLGGHLAPLTFLLGCQRCGTNSLYEGTRRAARCSLPHPAALIHTPACARHHRKRARREVGALAARRTRRLQPRAALLRHRHLVAGRDALPQPLPRLPRPLGRHRPN